ncbi:MAG: alpha/beta fold hydrolase [Dehalococcoidia bacterium]
MKSVWLARIPLAVFVPLLLLLVGDQPTLLSLGVSKQAPASDAPLEVFAFTGAPQPFVVPADIDCIAVEAAGAQGGEGANPDGLGAQGGLGGRAAAEIDVTPDETLMVYVGGHGGTPSGGYNGGGAGGDADEESGGAGGGASDIRRSPYGLPDRLVVAGGGGGGGGDNDSGGTHARGGGGGGVTGADGAPSGSDNPTPAGKGGTQTAGGAAPSAFDSTATSGALGQGGSGGRGPSNDDAGAGGGGGYYGGGGGAGEDDDLDTDGGGGGGGGSGFGPEGVTFETGVQTGNGVVEINHCAPPPVVFLHGFAGSTINCASTNLWPGPPPEFGEMMLASNGVSPGTGACAATVGALLETVQLAGFSVSDVYGSTANYLRNTFDDRAHFFAWDWRKSPDVSLSLLDSFIDDVLEEHDEDEVVIMAHSYGGLLARWYLENPSGADKVARVVTIGTPSWGAPKALFPLFAGIETPDFSSLDLIIADNSEFKDFARNLAGNYFLYPSAAYGSWLTVANVDFDQAKLLDYVNELGGNRDLLSQALTAHANIMDGIPPGNIPFEIVVGTGLPTISGVRIQNNGFVIVEYGDGDGTVPARSAARGLAGPGNPNADKTHYACGIGHVPLPGHQQVTNAIEDFLKSGDPVDGLSQSACPVSGLQFRIFELEALPAGAVTGAGAAEAIAPREADFNGEVDYLDLPNEKFIVTGDTFPDMVLPPAAFLDITKIGEDGAKGERRLYGPLSGEVIISPGDPWPTVLDDGQPVVGVEPGIELTWGDSNCSGGVDPVDSLLTLRFDAGLEANTGDCPEMGATINVLGASSHAWGDVDCSGGTDPIDALKLLRYDAGLGLAQNPPCPAVGETLTIAVSAAEDPNTSRAGVLDSRGGHTARTISRLARAAGRRSWGSRRDYTAVRGTNLEAGRQAAPSTHRCLPNKADRTRSACLTVRQSSRFPSRA